MKKLFILLFVSFEALALEAVVTVLETPMFKYKSYDAPVVQYLRKGDVIKVHPSLANDRDMDKYAPDQKKLEELRDRLIESPEYNQDPIFRGKVDMTSYLEDEFIPTLDRQGNTVYVLSSHIYVYFNDKRELEQKIIANDPTDYRLEEPLPKKYPLKTPVGLRGQLLFGLSQPSYESYDYPDDIKTKGYTSPADLSLTFLKVAPGNYKDRLFIGGTLGFRYSKNEFTFEDKRVSEETGLKLGIGPTISYDAFKGEKNRVNLSGTIMVNLIDRLYISQKLNSVQDNREYVAYSVAPRINIQYHRKDIYENLDFVLGTSMEMGAATNYRAKTAGSETSWWQNIGDDKFTTRTTFTLGGYVGLQSAY